jgi:hypothetical protein
MNRETKRLIKQAYKRGQIAERESTMHNLRPPPSRLKRDEHDAWRALLAKYIK